MEGLASLWIKTAATWLGERVFKDCFGDEVGWTGTSRVALLVSQVPAADCASVPPGQGSILWLEQFWEVILFFFFWNSKHERLALQ